MTVEDEQHRGMQGRLINRYATGGRAAYGFAGCAAAIALCGLAAHLG